MKYPNASKAVSFNRCASVLVFNCRSAFVRLFDSSYRCACGKGMLPPTKTIKRWHISTNPLTPTSPHLKTSKNPHIVLAQLLCTHMLDVDAYHFDVQRMRTTDRVRGGVVSTRVTFSGAVVISNTTCSLRIYNHNVLARDPNSDWNTDNANVSRLF